MRGKFRCSGIVRKNKCVEKVKETAAVDDPEEAEHVPPQSALRETRDDITFPPLDVVNNFILKAVEEHG